MTSNESVMRAIIYIFIYIGAITQVYAQKTGFILDISSIDSISLNHQFLYAENLSTPSTNTNANIVNIGNSLYYLRVVSIPTNSFELLGCCEADTVDFLGAETFYRISNRIGNIKADKLAIKYSKTLKKLSTWHIDRANSKLNSKFGKYRVKGCFVQISVCDCYRKYWKNGSIVERDSYISNIKKLENISKRDAEAIKKELPVIIDWLEKH